MRRKALATMHTYYTSISIILWVALGVLCVLTYENDRLRAENKRTHYITYALIMLSLLAEWAGVMLNGNEGFPAWVLRIVKCCDYILTPLAGGTLVSQMRIRNRWDTVLGGILAGNAVLQLVTLPTSWMLTIDAGNRYDHGPLYPVYMAVYVAVIIIVGIQFLVYGQSFKKQNRLSLYAILGLLVLGILLQELSSDKVRTAYLALTLGAAFLFIHSAEYSQLAADEQLSAQESLILTDALTGLLSRHAYAMALLDYSGEEPLPDDFVVFSVDVNGLKEANDTLGHDAGDELLCGAAHCLSQVFEKHGRCYRTGGDEFVVFAQMQKDEADKTLELLDEEAARWHGTLAKGLSLSTGYALAAEDPSLSCRELVTKADVAMYASKEAYYRVEGRDRRRRNR